VTSPTTVTTARGRTQTSKETRVANVEAREGVHRRAQIAGLGLMMGFFALAGLTLGAASLLVIGGVVLALFLFFPLFLLGLVGVLAGLEDHTVQQHNPSMDGTKWRNGSSADRG
jgi:Putative Actinobacterial Holin-X, holin superfamily III